jgi:hypothetical protein
VCLWQWKVLSLGEEGFAELTHVRVFWCHNSTRSDVPITTSSEHRWNGNSQGIIWVITYCATCDVSWRA